MNLELTAGALKATRETEFGMDNFIMPYQDCRQAFPSDVYFRFPFFLPPLLWLPFFLCVVFSLTL